MGILENDHRGRVAQQRAAAEPGRWNVPGVWRDPLVLTAVATIVVSAPLIALVQPPPLLSAVVVVVSVGAVAWYGVASRDAWLARRRANIRPRSIDEVVFREVERARRYEGQVSVVTIRLAQGSDPFRFVGDLSTRVRTSDHVLCEQPEQVTVVLPGVRSRAASKFAARALAGDERVAATAWASFPDDAMTAAALVVTVDDRLSGRERPSESA